MCRLHGISREAAKGLRAADPACRMEAQRRALGRASNFSKQAELPQPAALRHFFSAIDYQLERVRLHWEDGIDRLCTSVRCGAP